MDMPVRVQAARRAAAGRGAAGARPPEGARTACRRAAAPQSPAAPAPQAKYGDLSLGAEVRGDFPLISAPDQSVVYLDSAATSQKPAAVLDAMQRYYLEYNSNVHRGVHALSARATDEYEAARGKVARFINAASERELVWTRNASEAINLVAYAWGLDNLAEGDEVLLTVMEHHSNLVPWQLIAERTGCVLKHGRLGEDGALDLEHMRSLVTPRTKLVAMAHVSNTLGCVNPVTEVVEAAKAVGARVLLDACQSVPHMPVDVQALGADWLVASGHKMCGPTGIGFLWGSMEVLEEMSPFMGGGEMIQDVYLSHSTYAEPPLRFEAGTPAICEAIALGAACDYLTAIGMDRVHQYETALGRYLYDRLSTVEGIDIVGPTCDAPGGRAALAAFTSDVAHATDISTILDQTANVAVRSGHHCTQPLHRELGVNATARASLYIYNTPEEVDTFVAALEETLAFFREVNSA